jgi:hypothetical protein
MDYRRHLGMMLEHMAEEQGGGEADEPTRREQQSTRPGARRERVPD